MTQSEIDAKESLKSLEVNAKRAEELVKYLEDILKKASEQGGTVVDLAPLTKGISEAAEVAREAFADVQALKGKWENFQKQLSDHDNAFASVNEKIAALEGKFVALEAAKSAGSPEIASAPTA